MRYELTETQREMLSEARQRARRAQSRLSDVLTLIRDAHGIPADADGTILPDSSGIIVEDTTTEQAESA